MINPTEVEVPATVLHLPLSPREWTTLHAYATARGVSVVHAVRELVREHAGFAVGSTSYPEWRGSVCTTYQGAEAVGAQGQAQGQAQGGEQVVGAGEQVPAPLDADGE